MRLYDSTLPDGSRRLIVHLDERKRIAKGDPRLADEAFVGKSGDPDPEWCIDHTFGPVLEPPMTGTTRTLGGGKMRRMTVEEVEEQQEREVVALAREALARRRAEDSQREAAAADPFAGGGRKV
jgi:hypothetical protein